MYTVINENTYEVVCQVHEFKDGLAFGEAFYVIDTGDVEYPTPRLDRDTLTNIPGKVFTLNEIKSLAWEGIRRKRDTLLYQTDWTVGNDSPLNEMQKRAWRLYRQALRDLPEIQADPFSVIFPRKPGE